MFSYRYDFDRLSGTGIIVRVEDDKTTLRYTGQDALRVRDLSPIGLAQEARQQEFFD